MTALPTFGSIFSGGGVAEAGLRGLVDLAFAVEYDGAIAEVYRANHGDHVRVAAAQDVNVSTLPPVDVLWASPPCQAHSVARSRKLAERDDAEVGIVVLDYVRACQPKAVIIENVEQYGNHPVFHKIVKGLFAAGYWVHFEVVNAANHAVPQTRRRLILRAVRDSLVPMLPQPVPWVGWYAAIEDLIPTLPESRFAKWQLARLDAGVLKNMQIGPNFFVGGANKSASFLEFAVENRVSIPGIRNGDEPMNTVPADSATNACGRAFLVGGANTSEGQAAPGVGVSSADEPTRCVNASNSSHWRAFIVDGKPANHAGALQVLDADTPINTVTASQPRHPLRAFLVTNQNAAPNASAGPRVYAADEPDGVVIAGSASRTRAWLEQGRVVAMTPRALARFQSMPDWYVLPEKNSLSCKIIGNGVPSKLARVMVESVLPVIGFERMSDGQES